MYALRSVCKARGVPSPEEDNSHSSLSFWDGRFGIAPPAKSVRIFVLIKGTLKFNGLLYVSCTGHLPSKSTFVLQHDTRLRNML